MQSNCYFTGILVNLNQGYSSRTAFRPIEKASFFLDLLQSLLLQHHPMFAAKSLRIQHLFRHSLLPSARLSLADPQEMLRGCEVCHQRRLGLHACSRLHPQRPQGPTEERFGPSAEHSSTNSTGGTVGTPSCVGISGQP